MILKHIFSLFTPISSTKIFTQFVIGLFFLLMVLPFGKWGLFFDGITYSTISRNLAIGLGSFWKPFYTPQVLSSFFEHPPLVFGIQSLFFKALGEDLWVEKLYTWVIFLLTIWVLYKIWVTLFDDKRGFLLVLLFFSLPIVNRNGYRDNFLETTQSLFVLASVLFVLKAYMLKMNRELQHEKKFYVFLVIASFFMVAGFLSKGPTVFFPMVLPILIGFCHYLFLDRFALEKSPTYIESGDYRVSQKKIWHSFVMGSLGVSLLTFILLSFFWLFDDSRYGLNSYFENQVFASLWGGRKGNNISGLYFFRFLFIQTNLVLVVWVFLVGLCKYTRCWKLTITDRYWGLLFLLIFLSAALPLVFSQRISHHYLLPALPYLALSAASYIHTSMSSLLAAWDQNRLWFRQFAFLSTFFLILVLIIGGLNFGSYTDKNYGIVIEDVDKLKKLYSISDQAITTCPSSMVDWRLIAYAYRMHKIWLTQNQTDYFLSDGSCEVDQGQFQKVDTLFFGYGFYKKIK